MPGAIVVDAQDRFARIAQQCIDRRRNVLGADAIEAGKSREIEQRIRVVHLEFRSDASSAAMSAGVPTFAHGPS